MHARFPSRFYELRTNRPLYFTTKYELVYTDDDLPTHYAFITGNSLARIRAEYERLAATDPSRLKPARSSPRYESSAALTAAARAAVDALDERGAWVEDGRLNSADPERRVMRILSTQTLIRNVDTLSRFLAANN